MESFARRYKTLFRRTITGGVVAVAMLQGSLAAANPQPGALYDARSSAMAGAGVAFLDSGAASFHNPANMEKVAGSVTTMTLAPFLNDISAPFPSEGTITTGYRLGPLGQLGTAWRVHERITVGGSVFVVAGSGLEYDNVPAGDLCNNEQCNQKAEMIQAELQIPVAIKIVEGLSVGLAYRMTLGTLSQDVWQLGANGFEESKLSLTATNFKGVQAGIHYQPLPDLEIGVNYRNAVALHWSGTANGVSQPDSAFAALKYTAPHFVSGGVALHLLEQALMITAEYRYLFYSKVNDGLETFNANGTPAHWQDAWTAILAGEYHITQAVPVRLGVSYGQQSITDATATFLGVPPGNPLSISAGSGYARGNWGVDAAVLYAWYSHTVPAAENPLFAGDYNLSSLEFFVSATYKH